jgi:hypothetical protein
MSDEERKTAFALRQAELDDIAQDLKGRATKTWKKPASFALTLSGVAVALATGHPLAAALTVGAAAVFARLCRGPLARKAQFGVQKVAHQIRVGVHVWRKSIVAIDSVETDESIEIPLSLLYSIDARM